jgi:hypothetical protein
MDSEQLTAQSVIHLERMLLQQIPLRMQRLDIGLEISNRATSRTKSNACISLGIGGSLTELY